MHCVIGLPTAALGYDYEVSGWRFTSHSRFDVRFRSAPATCPGTFGVFHRRGIDRFARAFFRANNLLRRSEWMNY